MFGEAASINCANFIYFEAFHDAVCLGKPQVVPALLDELMKLHLGQVLLHTRSAAMTRHRHFPMTLLCHAGTRHILPRQRYLPERAAVLRHGAAQDCRTLPPWHHASTGEELTHARARLDSLIIFQSFSDDCRDFIPLCNDLGLYYQVMDDVLNLKSAEMFGHKSFCEDLTEGKFSFPIVHHVLSSPGDSRVLSVMRKKTADATLKQFAVRCLEETQSFAYALKFSEAVADRIRQRCKRAFAVTVIMLFHKCNR